MALRYFPFKEADIIGTFGADIEILLTKRPSTLDGKWFQGQNRQEMQFMAASYYWN